MKKFSALFLVLFLITTQIFSATALDKVTETRIENGLTVFVLEDYTNPQVRLELCLRAGFSSQSVEEAGFFTLLSNLVQKTSPVSFDSVQVNSDSTRFILDASPALLESILEDFSDAVFNANFSDSLLKSEFASLKRQVLLNANDPATLMNASIDSKVFSNEPWRNDSGIYPALFEKLSENEVRTILSRVQENFYVPGNAALFISGNIQKENVLSIVNSTFGRFYSNRKINYRPLVISAKGSRKFVIHSKDFSEDLTQVVLQYENLSKEEADFAENIFNYDYSRMKQYLCASEVLNIPGAEYINIAAASKTGSTRLIAQSLLQNIPDVSPALQAEVFHKTVLTNAVIYPDEYEASISQQSFLYNKLISSSSAVMEALSELWQINPYNFSGESEIEKLKTVKENLHEVSPERICEVLQADTPFVFVVLNSKQYNKYKKSFDENGYEEINSKNSSWYADTLYKNVKSLIELSRLAQKKKETEKENPVDYVQNFVDENKKAVTEILLSNGIPVYIKQNPNTTGVSLVLSVDGGNIRTADNHGFEEVMINILTMNILRQIKAKQAEGLVLNDFDISSETELNSSHIMIECDTEDFYAVISALARSLVMDDVIPSDADRIVQGRKTRKRLENGSTVNQLYSAGINSLMAGTVYTRLFDTEKDVLENTNYEEILSEYPKLLDSSRYSLIVSGNLDPEIFVQSISDVFSVLQKSEIPEERFTEKKIIWGSGENQKSFPKGKSKKVKLEHTFLTDVPAKDAGPMPAVLIPTKSFADPVIYFAESPEAGSEDFFVLNAVLPYLQEQLTKAMAEKMHLYNCKVNITSSTRDIPLCTFSFSSVERISAVDNLYQTVLTQIVSDLTNSSKSLQTVQNVQTKYISYAFSEAYTNMGSALLMEESLLESKDIPSGKNVLYYLNKYEMANQLSAEKLLDVIEKYLGFENLYRVYSSEARK